MSKKEQFWENHCIKYRVLKRFLEVCGRYAASGTHGGGGTGSQRTVGKGVGARVLVPNIQAKAPPLTVKEKKYNITRY